MLGIRFLQPPSFNSLNSGRGCGCEPDLDCFLGCSSFHAHVYYLAHYYYLHLSTYTLQLQVQLKYSFLKKYQKPHERIKGDRCQTTAKNKTAASSDQQAPPKKPKAFLPHWAD